MDDITFNILRIERGTTVDGPGFRTSIYFAGCNHRCPECHNPATWDFNAGTPMSIDKILEIVKEEDFNVTFSGGDPLMHPREITELAKKISGMGYTIWMYTGYTIEEIMDSDELQAPLPYIETIVDGPFIKSLRDPDLPFRGSSNQRIIHTQTLPLSK